MIYFIVVSVKGGFTDREVGWGGFLRWAGEIKTVWMAGELAI